MKSFATSICPIKKSSRSEYDALGGSPAWRTIPQPISKRFLSGVITGLRHGDPAHRCFRAISAWRDGHPSALRHGDLAHRYFRGIPAWRTITQPISKRFLSGVITALRHGDPAHRYSSAIPTCRTIQLSLSNRPLTGPRPVFGTSTLPTGASEPSPRGEAVIYRPFGTATLPTDASVASSRGKAFF